MARPKKQTVDYFPHYCKCGRTIYILESRFGNDGYAFWFKTLEILGESEGHFYDCSNSSNWAFMLARTHVSEETAKDIISVLIELGKIDAELWEKRRIIWVENFVRNLTEAYRTRHTDIPVKPCFDDRKPVAKDILSEKTRQGSELSDKETPKEKESKVKENKEKDTVTYLKAGDLWNAICVSLPKVLKLNDKRRQKIKCRFEEFSCEPDEFFQRLEDLFKRVEASDFLTGRTENRNSWTATFDWIFENGSNWVKVMEGNYDNKPHKSPQTGENAQAELLGVGEYIDLSGRRTYGSGRATIPQTAPPRPSEKHQWSAETNTWIIL